MSLFVLREFDRLTEKGEVYRGGESEPQFTVNAAAYTALVDLILEKRETETDGESETFFTLSYHKSSHSNCIIIQNYVGVIRLPSGDRLEILPKVSAAGSEEQDKELFIRMLLSLPEFRKWKALGMADQQVRRMPLADIFIEMFVRETSELVKRGLKSAYVQQEGNLPFLKGRLLVQRNRLVNRFHPERFWVQYDEFVPNMPQNRLLKATLLKLMRVAHSPDVVRDIRRLLPAFEQVQASVHYAKDFQLAVSSRATREYDTLMHWAKVFLGNKSFTPFDGKSKAESLLFPMEKLFESYVAQQLRLFLPSDTSLSAQNQGKKLLGEYRLRPDIVIRNRASEPVLILDTKWKHLSEDRYKHYGVAQADIYQMFAYSRKYGVKEVILLYPEEKGTPMQKTWQETEIAPHPTYIHVQTLNLPLLEDADYVSSLFRRWNLLPASVQ